MSRINKFIFLIVFLILLIVSMIRWSTVLLLVFVVILIIMIWFLKRHDKDVYFDDLNSAKESLMSCQNISVVNQNLKKVIEQIESLQALRNSIEHILEVDWEKLKLNSINEAIDAGEEAFLRNVKSVYKIFIIIRHDRNLIDDSMQELVALIMSNERILEQLNNLLKVVSRMKYSKVVNTSYIDDITDAIIRLNNLK